VSLALGAALLAPLLLRGWSAFLNARGLFVVAWVGVVATAVAYLLYVQGLARVPAATAGTLSLAEPLTAMVLGIAVLGERPSVVALIGALLVIGGLTVAAFPRRSLSGVVRSEPTTHVANV
jgi:drug/metabolite transporter, DME family